MVFFTDGGDRIKEGWTAPGRVHAPSLGRRSDSAHPFGAGGLAVGRLGCCAGGGDRARQPPAGPAVAALGVERGQERLTNG